MTDEQRKRFTVISNPDMEQKEKHKTSYQTNPLTEKLVKFRDKEKFSVQDFLKW